MYFFKNIGKFLKKLTEPREIIRSGTEKDAIDLIYDLYDQTKEDKLSWAAPNNYTYTLDTVKFKLTFHSVDRWFDGYDTETVIFKFYFIDAPSDNFTMKFNYMDHDVFYDFINFFNEIGKSKKRNNSSLKTALQKL